MAVSKDPSTSVRKLALIIGNDEYSKPYSKLKNSCNNAKDLGDLLKTINFDVTTFCDLTKQKMATCIINFAETISNGDIVLFYYSGYACQVKEKNYLIPVDDARIESDRDIEDFALNIERQIDRLVKKNPSCLTMFILDCCKPYLLKNATKASNTPIEGKALSEITPPAGAFIQFACAANQTTKDVPETERNSLFTKHLLRNITQENIDYTQLFQSISDAVSKETKQKMKPFSKNKFQGDQEIHLNPKKSDPLDDNWDEKKEGNLESAKKVQAQLKAYYDSFPSIDDVTNETRPEVKEAKAFTESILRNLPSGNVTERATACHVLKNVLESQNIQCLFFDSTHGKGLHDSSGILAEIGSNERPFVLRLNSSEGLGSKTAPKTEHGDIRLAQLLTDAIDKKESHPILEDVRCRLAQAHQTDKENICLQSTVVGSFIVVYDVKNWTQSDVKSLSELPKRLKNKFEQYATVKIHPLLCRAAFDISSFDSKGNKTFGNAIETHDVGPPGRTQTYISPAGWTRYGLKVLGKYSNGDSWLEPFRDPRNWYRAFHGTGRASADDFNKSKQSFDQQYASLDAMASIHKTGFRPARFAAYGGGVYCSPDPTFPEKGYVGAVECDTQEGRKKFKFMLQVAVNPDGTTFTPDKSIWVVPNPEDIRPYGILIKEA